MVFIEELQTFGKTILRWVYSFVAFTLFFFAFGFKEVALFGRQFLIPFPSHESFSAMFFDKIRKDILPEVVDLVVINPLEAFWAQIGISFFLAFIITLPFLLYCFLRYLFPAFTKKEQKTALKAIFPSVGLFLLGSIFSYYLLIPATIEILYLYVINIGAVPFISVKEFISLVLFLILGTGILFMFPVFMVLLGSLGIVEASFWKDNWRYSLLAFLILTAIITPDGSGITTIILLAPLTLLYSIGYIGSVRFTQKILNKKVVK